MSSEKVPASARALLASLDAAGRRLMELGRADLPGLTAADPDTGERWDVGQVWAHVTELVPYWTVEARKVVEARGPTPVSFGRGRTDPGRIAAVEAGRRKPIREQTARCASAIGELRAFLAGLPPEAWRAQGQHPRFGVMDLHRIVDEFVVRHLEEHAQQLEQLRAKT